MSAALLGTASAQTLTLPRFNPKPGTELRYEVTQTMTANYQSTVFAKPGRTLDLVDKARVELMLRAESARLANPTTLRYVLTQRALEPLADGSAVDFVSADVPSPDGTVLLVRQRIVTAPDGQVRYEDAGSSPLAAQLGQNLFNALPGQDAPPFFGRPLVRGQEWKSSVEMDFAKAFGTLPLGTVTLAGSPARLNTITRYLGQGELGRLFFDTTIVLEPRTLWVDANGQRFEFSYDNLASRSAYRPDGALASLNMKMEMTADITLSDAPNVTLPYVLRQRSRITMEMTLRLVPQ